MNTYAGLIKAYKAAFHFIEEFNHIYSEVLRQCFQREPPPLTHLVWLHYLWRATYKPCLNYRVEPVLALVPDDVVYYLNDSDRLNLIAGLLPCFPNGTILPGLAKLKAPAGKSPLARLVPRILGPETKEKMAAGIPHHYPNANADKVAARLQFQHFWTPGRKNEAGGI